MAAKSARVNDLEWKEQLAQLSEDLRTNSRLVEARNDETEKTAELTEQMRRLHDRFGSTERQIKGAALDELQSRRVDDRQRSSYAVDSTTWLKHTSVITDDLVRIVALLNMEIFQAATYLSGKI